MFYSVFVWGCSALTSSFVTTTSDNSSAWTLSSADKIKDELMGILRTKILVYFHASMLARMQAWSHVRGHVLTWQPTYKQFKHASLGGMLVGDGSSTRLARLTWRFYMIHTYCMDYSFVQNAVRTMSQVRFRVCAVHHRHLTRKMSSGARHLLRERSSELTRDVMLGALSGIRILGLNSWALQPLWGRRTQWPFWSAHAALNHGSRRQTRVQCTLHDYSGSRHGVK